MIDAARTDALIAAVRDVARTQILPRFRSLDPSEIETKTGPEDLVTVADRAAEAELAARIADILPDASVVGEEAVADDPAVLDRLRGGGICVIVDPVDGTSNFARGLSVFGVILAVTEGGETTFGLLYDPVLDDWVSARRGEGAWFCRADGTSRRLRVRPERPVADQTGYLPLALFDPAARPGLAALMPCYSRVQTLRCSCHEYRMLALGQADWSVAAGSKPWDHAAGVLVLSEAGGVTRTLAGGAYDVTRPDDTLIAATNQPQLDALRATIAGAIG